MPFYPQQGQWCGPSSLATVLHHAGFAETPQTLAHQIFTPGLGGSLQTELLVAARRQGALAYPLRPHFTDLLREVAAGHPVLVLQDNGFGLFTAWHYAVVVGYDYGIGEIYLRSSRSERLAMPFTVFEASWRRGNYWSMVVLPAGSMPASANELDMLSAVAAMEAAAQAHTDPQSAGEKKRQVLRSYESILRRWPSSEVASIGLANSYYTQREWRAAEVVLRHALSARPHSIPLRNNLIQLLTEQGRCATAQEELGQLPTSPDARIRFEAELADTLRNLAARVSGGDCQDGALH